MSAETLGIEQGIISVVGIPLARDQVVPTVNAIEGTPLTAEEVAAEERRKADAKLLGTMIDHAAGFDADNVAIAHTTSAIAEKLSEATVSYQERGRLARERAAKVQRTFTQSEEALTLAEQQASRSTAEKVMVTAEYHSAIDTSGEPLRALIDSIEAINLQRPTSESEAQDIAKAARDAIAEALADMTSSGEHPSGLLGRLLAEVVTRDSLLDITGMNEIDLEELEQRQANYEAARADVIGLTGVLTNEKARTEVIQRQLEKAGSTLGGRHRRDDDSKMLTRIMERLSRKPWRRSIGGIVLANTNVLEPKPAAGTTPKEIEA